MPLQTDAHIQSPIDRENLAARHHCKAGGECVLGGGPHNFLFRKNKSKEITSQLKF